MFVPVLSILPGCHPTPGLVFPGTVCWVSLIDDEPLAGSQNTSHKLDLLQGRKIARLLSVSPDNSLSQINNAFKSCSTVSLRCDTIIALSPVNFGF